MRVLYVVSLFPCWSETFIVREITALVAGGADVRILSLKPPSEKLVQPDAEALLPRVRHPYAPAAALLHRPRQFARHPLSITRASARIAARLAHQPREVAKSLEALGRGVEQLDWIEEFDPDVIHAHWGTYPSTVAWALARILDKPFGMTCHAHDIFVNDHLLREKIETARVGVTISRFNVDYLTDRVTPRAKDRLHVVHCGVDLSATPFRRDDREPGLIVAVGRLDPIKGFDVLVDALGKLAKEGREFRCRLIGQGPLEADLKARAARQGLTDVLEFTGALPQAEVRAALYSASIFTLPSVVTKTGDRDGIPVSLMEAMAAGAPVVSTRVSGIPELVADGETGLLVPERDPRALAAALARLLDDPALGDRLAATARAKVESEFDAFKEAEKCEGCSPMPPSDANRGTPNVIGDIALVAGPGGRDWLRSLDGWQLLTSESDAVQVATRGAVKSGKSKDGARWAAVADLVEGELGDGTKALADGTPPQRDWRGRFAQVVWTADGRVVAITDHFSTLPLFSLERGEVFALATDPRDLSRSPWAERRVDLESVYHYLNFGQIPAPRTIFEDVRRLEPSTRLRRETGKPVAAERYFVPEYPEDLRGSDDDLAVELRERIIASVEAYGLGSAPGWGCFLSGGTDSSSIVSILARREGPGRVKSFSIGFAEEGYDETGYAKIAAEAAGATPFLHSVSRAEAQALVDRVVDGYDQPFGNASAIPTIACADLATRNGVGTLLAGDGGDEIFGGNERYAKDRVMETWFALPEPVKAAGLAVGGVAGRSSSHFFNRVENFFQRSSLPNPDRFYTDDSFASDHYDELLRPEFRAKVGRQASLDVMREIYGLGKTGGPLHRIMRLDLLMAIARNDIPKVHGAARSAGVTVRFPLLDPRLVAFTSRLAERQKVRGLKKRYLFKRAMKGILPEETLKKKKQGFGLPTSVWLKSDEAFKAVVRETLFDGRAAARGWVEPSFVEGLLGAHERGSWDHADDIWRLFILERWMRRHVDAP